VRAVALPEYDRLRRANVDDRTALLHILLHLLAVNGDTNLVARGGLSALRYVQSYARSLLDNGGAIALIANDSIARFDDALIARGLSPGGSADLLAIAWFRARFGE
jgi:triphosphoribosyl-dephospho-CoA synthase